MMPYISKQKSEGFDVRAPPWRGRRRWVCRSTVPISMCAAERRPQTVLMSSWPTECRRSATSRRGCRTSRGRRARYLSVRAPPWRGRRRWVCRSTVPISMSAMVAAEQLVDEGAVHLVPGAKVRSEVLLGSLRPEVDDDGCAVARCRFRCPRWLPQNN